MSVKQQTTDHSADCCHYCGAELSEKDADCVVAIFPQNTPASPYTVKICENCLEHHWELQSVTEFGL